MRFLRLRAILARSPRITADRKKPCLQGLFTTVGLPGDIHWHQWNPETTDISQVSATDILQQLDCYGIANNDTTTACIGDVDFVVERMQTLARKLHPNNPWANFQFSFRQPAFCKNKMSLYSALDADCELNQAVSMKELYLQ